MYKVFFMPEAKKGLEKIIKSDKSHFQRIMRGIDSLTVDPYIGKALTRELKGKLSLRVGFYRIIYTIENKTISIYILNIGHRKEIYK